jgi:hypothetical protein
MTGKTITIRLPNRADVVEALCMKYGLFEETCMDAVEHSFKIDLDEPEVIKPLPYKVIGYNRTKKSERLFLPDHYEKVEIEFFDIVKECAEYIDKIHDVNLRTKYHKDLSKIFVLRHKPTIMRLFRELVNLKIMGQN